MSLTLYQETAQPILGLAPPPLAPGPETWSAQYPDFFPPIEFPEDIYRSYTSETVSAYVILPFTGNKLLAPVLLNEMWQDHFGTRGWNTIKDQVDAGYPIYAQPVPQFGSYKEVIDYGAIFNSVIVNIDWGTVNIFGTVNVTCETRYSLDGLVWSSPVIGTSTFVPSMRYLEVTIKFEAVN